MAIVAPGRSGRWRAPVLAAPLVLRTPLLRRLLVSWALWTLAEWALLVVLSSIALERGGVRGVALLGVLRLLPAAATAPVLVRLFGRLPRGMVIAGVEIGWACLLVGMAAALRLSTSWPLAVLLVVASAVSTLLRPSVGALIPAIERDPTRLSAANSTYALAEAVASLVGPVLAAVLLATVAPEVTLIVLAGLLALAAAFAGAVRTDVRRRHSRRHSVRRDKWRRLSRPHGRGPSGGLAAWWASPSLRAIYLVFLAQTFVRGVLNVVLISSAATLAGRTDGAGLLFASIGVGSVIGGLLAHFGVMWPVGPPFVLGMVGWGLPLVVLGLRPAAPAAYLALVTVGTANAVASVFGYTIVHRRIPDADLGPAFAAFWSAVWASTALGSLAAYWLLATGGLGGTLVSIGALLAVAAALTWPAVRTADRDLDVDPADVLLLSSVPMFAPLGRVALEQLVRDAEEREVPAGALMTVQGQSGEDFFLIRSGRFQAEVDGVVVRVMERADCFGEVAALRASPRTATVRALDDGDVLRIRGRAFVLAVTGHAAAERAAEDLVRVRLHDAPEHPTCADR